MKLWKPEHGEVYYYIHFDDINGLDVVSEEYDDNDPFISDSFYVFPDNYFQTEEKAEAAKNDLESFWITVANKYQQL